MMGEFRLGQEWRDQYNISVATGNRLSIDPIGTQRYHGVKIMHLIMHLNEKRGYSIRQRSPVIIAACKDRPNLNGWPLAIFLQFLMPESSVVKIILIDG